MLGDDGAATTKGVTLESAAAALDVVGGVAADGQADLTVHARAKPGPNIGRLDLAAAVKGPLPRPQADVSLDVEDLKSAAGALRHLQAHFAALPAKPGDPQAPIALTGEADMAGLALADPAQAALVGHSGRLALQATATPDGALDIARLNLDAEALHARFAGKAAREALSGQFSADADDLARLGPLSGLKLKGSAHVAAALSGDPARDAYAADVKAELKGFASGEAALDGFAGPGPSLRGAVKIAADGYAFDKLALTGAGGRALIDGALGATASNLRATLAVPDAHRLDPRIAGAIAAEVKVAGPLSAPDADATATLSDGRLLGRSAPRLSLDAHAKGGASLALKLAGEIDGKALQGDLRLARGGDAIMLDRAAFSLGGAKIDGAGKLAKGLADGRLTVAAPRLDDLSPLALTPLSGSLQADVRLASADGRQNAAIEARSPEAGFGAARLAGLDVDMRLTDLFGDARADGTAAADRIVAAGETVSGVKLAAKAGAFDLAANLRGMALRAKGALHMAQRALRLDAFSARGRGPSITLVQPATLAFDDAGVATKDLTLALGAGRLSLKGRAGCRLDLQARAEAIPLALADLASPGLGLAGTASGEARLGGEAAAPSGDWRVALAGLAAPASRSAGLSPLDVKASGRLAGGRTSLDATVSAGTAGSLRVAGSAPLRGDGPLDLKASGRLDVAGLSRVLAASGQRASGTLALDARLAGDLAHPKAAGTAVLSGGAFADEISGLRLTDLSATIAARGDEVEIAKASAKTPGGGTVTASGRVRLDPAAGFPGAIRLSADKARLVATEIVTADAGLALDLSGPLARDPSVAGRIDVKAIDVEIPGRLPGSDAPLADVRHIDPGPTARARLALIARKRRAAGPGFSARLALAVSAPSRVTVHGRGDRRGIRRRAAGQGNDGRPADRRRLRSAPGIADADRRADDVLARPRQLRGRRDAPARPGGPADADRRDRHRRRDRPRRQADFRVQLQSVPAAGRDPFAHPVPEALGQPLGVPGAAARQHRRGALGQWRRVRFAAPFARRRQPRRRFECERRPGGRRAAGDRGPPQPRRQDRREAGGQRRLARLRPDQAAAAFDRRRRQGRIEHRRRSQLGILRRAPRVVANLSVACKIGGPPRRKSAAWKRLSLRSPSPPAPVASTLTATPPCSRACGELMRNFSTASTAGRSGCRSWASNRATASPISRRTRPPISKAITPRRRSARCWCRSTIGWRPPTSSTFSTIAARRFCASTRITSRRSRRSAPSCRRSSISSRWRAGARAGSITRPRSRPPPAVSSPSKSTRTTC